MSPNDLAYTYAAQALGLTGFVILDWRIAVRQRPDLFATGVEAGAVNATAWRLRLRTPPGMVKARADIGDLRANHAVGTIVGHNDRVRGFTAGKYHVDIVRLGDRQVDAGQQLIDIRRRIVRGVAIDRPGRR